VKNRRSLKVPRPTGWPGLPPTPQKGDNTRDWYPFSGMMQQIPPEVVCDFEGLPLNPPWQIVWGDLGHFWGNSIGVFGLYWRIENSGIKRRNPFICSVATFGDARPFWEHSRISFISMECWHACCSVCFVLGGTAGRRGIRHGGLHLFTVRTNAWQAAEGWAPGAGVLLEPVALHVSHQPGVAFFEHGSVRKETPSAFSVFLLVRQRLFSGLTFSH